ncbi:unnamed protein product [Amaranthus hypochondriacus]
MEIGLVILVLSFVVPSHVHGKPKIQAIYQFGDSISDTGNLIREGSNGANSPFAKLPYGQTYFHKPNGRCSDGLLIIDYFAQALKLPFLNAFLNKNGNFSHGVNFAVAGSTALSTETLATKNIMSPMTNSSLSVQLRWFKSHLSSICSHPSDCKHKLANALFIIEIGGNDFNYAFSQFMPMQSVRQLIDQVVLAISSTVSELISLGATRVVVPGNFAIGCIPVYLTGFETSDSMMYDNMKCLQNLNEFAMFQNSRLQQALAKLQRHNPNVTIVYADYFNAMRDLLQDAPSHGFEKRNIYKACCGFGDNDYNFDMSRMCGNDGVPVCAYPQKYVSWDGIHMTQAAYKFMANTLLNQILPKISH